MRVEFCLVFTVVIASCLSYTLGKVYCSLLVFILLSPILQEWELRMDVTIHYSECLDNMRLLIKNAKVTWRRKWCIHIILVITEKIIGGVPLSMSTELTSNILLH